MEEYEEFYEPSLVTGISAMEDNEVEKDGFMYKFEKSFAKILKKISSKMNKKNYDELTDKVKEKIEKKIENLIEKYNNEKYVRMGDKIMFVFGLLRVIFEAYLLGAKPCMFPLYYTIMMIFSVFVRYFYYRYLRLHYFLLDFCYWANFLIVAYLWLYPESQFLFITVYAFSVGPLLIAIPIFRNSLVLHSFEKVTSSFIHIGPPLTMWAIRYNNCDCWNVSKITPTLGDYLRNALVYYFIWAVVYHFIIFKLTFKRCQKKTNTTLYNYHLEDKKGFFYKLTGLLGERLRPLSFISIHLIFSTVTLVVTYISLYHMYIQLLFMFVGILLIIWTTATYYLEIFSKNYEMKLQQLKRIKIELDSAMSSRKSSINLKDGKIIKTNLNESPINKREGVNSNSNSKKKTN